MNQKYLYTLSVAALLLATACTDDLGVQELPVESGKGYTLRVGASMGPSSRMAIENDGEALNYYWTSDDSFTVFDRIHNQQTEFTLDSVTFQENSAKAEFVGTPQTAYQYGQKLYAVYNKNEEVKLDAYGNVNFDLSNQDGKLTDKFQYMWGDATFKNTDSLEFVFRHLVTTLQVKVAVPEGVKTLSNVTLYSRNLVPKATLVLNKAPYDTESQFGIGDLVYSYDIDGHFNFGSITLNGEFTAEAGYVSFYIYTLSAKQYSQSSTWYNSDIRPFVLFTDETGQMHTTVDLFYDKEMEMGAAYSLEAKKSIPLVDFENESEVNGNQGDPYQIANEDQLYSWMMRSFLDLRNKNNNEYDYCHYQLTKDLHMDNRALWYPIRLYNGSFDGNGKTIDGNQEIYVGEGPVGMFGYFEHSTMNDFTLDVDIDLVFKRNWGTSNSTGTLVGEMHRGVMHRCFFTGSMNCHSFVSGDLGGLIGRGGSSTIECCGFSGDIVNEGHNSRIGGLVGRNNSWSSDRSLTINACYSAGTFKVGNNNNGYYGGITSEMYDPGVSISNCWSGSTLNSYWDYELVVSSIGGVAARIGNGEDMIVKRCYWSNAIGEWSAYPDVAVSTHCGTFEGSMPTSTQLQELNYAIMGTGMKFSEENGHLVKSTQTGVPPSDIENW